MIMKIYILLRDCEYCDGDVQGVFAKMKDAEKMMNSFDCPECYTIQTQEVIQ